MLVFLGLDWDSAPERGAKLKALQEYYGTSDPRAMNMLAADSLAPTNSARGSELIINSHGNRKTFSGLDAQKFFDLLKSKGFQQGSFGKIYLMACLSGQQDQAGIITENFARDLHRIFVNHGITCMIYAPRGFLTYSVSEKTERGQKYWSVDKIYIKAPERNYPLSEGMLLVV